jgi:hypothetical protein
MQSFGKIFIESVKDKLLYSTGDMIMTGEDRTTQRKACPRATLSTTKQSLHLWRSEVDSLSPGHAL